MALAWGTLYRPLYRPWRSVYFLPSPATTQVQRQRRAALRVVDLTVSPQHFTILMLVGSGWRRKPFAKDQNRPKLPDVVVIARGLPARSAGAGRWDLTKLINQLSGTKGVEEGWVGSWVKN